MAATFAPGSASTVASLGFDDTASPPWLSLPLPGTKTVLLRGGSGLTLGLSQAGTAAFKELSSTGTGDRLIEITATKAGTVRLEATGAAKASLDITVKAQKKLNTFIHFVFDKSRRTTNRGLTEALQAIEVANKLLVPQVNVLMARRDSGGISLPFDLPNGVPVGDANVESALFSHLDPNSDYNIFFVQQVWEPQNRAVTVAYSTTDPKGKMRNLCVLPNISGGQELAHELGHFLLDGYPSLDRTGHPIGAPRTNLMTTYPNTFSLLIPKQQANFMNPSGFP